MNPLIQGHSGTTPEMSRNTFSINHGKNQDDSQSDPHPEAGLFNNQMTQKSGPEDGHDMVTGVTEQTRNGHYMVTGATERHYMVTGATERHYMVTGATERHYMVTGATERHYMVTGATERHDMVTGVQKESLCDHDMMTGATEQIRTQHDTYCSPGTSSGKQEKNRSTSQPQFRCKRNTTGTS